MLYHFSWSEQASFHISRKLLTITIAPIIYEPAPSDGGESRKFKSLPNDLIPGCKASWLHRIRIVVKKSRESDEAISVPVLQLNNPGLDGTRDGEHPGRLILVFNAKYFPI